MDSKTDISVDLIFNDNGVVKGIDRVNKKFNEMLKQSLSLANVNNRITTSMKDLNSNLKIVGTSLDKTLKPTKGGFDVDKYISLDKLQQLPAVVKTSFDSMKSYNPMKELSANDEIARLEGNFKKVQKVVLDDTYDAIMNKGNLLKTKTTMQFQEIGTVLNNVNKKIKKTTAEMTKIPFAGWAMSIMFFGMAMQRTFGTIQKTATKTFQDVMHSTEGAVTNFDLLEGSVKYLQFTIGEALEPVVAYLIPIIDWIQQWISDNPTLAAGIMTWGLILGAIFTVGGAGMLAINGFTELGMKITGATSRIDGLKASINGLGRMVGLAVAIDVTMELITGEKDFKESIAKILVAAGLLAGITTPIGAAALTIGVVFAVADAYGKLDALLYYMGLGFGMVLDGITFQFKAVWNSFSAIINGIISGINVIQRWRGAEEIKWNAPIISLSSFADDFKTKYEEMQKNMELDPSLKFRQQAEQERMYTSQTQTSGGYNPNQFYFAIQLDKEQIAHTITPMVSQDIQQSFNYYTTGG